MRRGEIEKNIATKERKYGIGQRGTVTEAWKRRWWERETAEETKQKCKQKARGKYRQKLFDRLMKKQNKRARKIWITWRKQGENVKRRSKRWSDESYWEAGLVRKRYSDW